MVEEDVVIGFDGEAATIIDRLTKRSEDLEVISIFGMPGLGKTTLARKIYNHPAVEYSYMTRAWIYVSQSFNAKDIFLQILRVFNQRYDVDYKNMSEYQLAEVVREKLNREKYLVVMDDIWTLEAWDTLKMAFQNSKRGSTVLMTTRHQGVALYADSAGVPHRLRFLTDDESWQLLRNKVCGSGQRSLPEELENVGRKITVKCGGLPLAIVVIAGVLLERYSKHEWEMVAESIDDVLMIKQNPLVKSLELSYDRLSYELKVCFLFFASFPHGHKIPVDKLIYLWIAEGFVQQIGKLTLEDEARVMLKELENRNLVIVIRSLDGRMKSCCVHDILFYFCKNRADKEENFVKEIMANQLLFASQTELDSYRHLCVHDSNVLEFFPQKATGRRVRSFLSIASPSQVTEEPLPHVISILRAFPLLRVLEVEESLKFSRFPRDLTKLFHLRYLAISCNSKLLPKQLGYLWNMQILMVNTSESTLEVRANIWNMSRLRHFQTNTSAQLPSAPKSSNDSGPVSGNLQSLSTISPESCTKEVFTQTPNVKKLGIKGELLVLFDTKSKENLFENLGKLDLLESLKMLNTHVTDNLSLPQAHKFPRKLRKLTLSNTSLGWKDMSTLGKLEELEFLKLKANAFKGKNWEPEEGGFRHLEILYIEMSDLVSWKASKHHLPRLRCLILKQCSRLEAIPSGLAEIPSLQVLDLFHTTPSAAASAREIQLKKEKEAQGSKSKGFKLAIYPLDH